MAANLHLLLSLLFAFIGISLAVNEVTIHIPSSTPHNASGPIDLSYPGFAFEQSSFYNYSFDEQGNPNEFSQNLVHAVLSRTGGTPLLRVGGTSGDHGRFDASQKNATNFPATKFGPKTKISGDRLSLGPSFFKAFKNWPGAKFELMVPFYDTAYAHSIEWAKAGQIPARNSVREGQEFQNLKEQSTLAQQVDYVHFVPPEPGIGDVQVQSFDQAVNEAVLLRKEPKAALDEAAGRADQLLQENREKYQA